MYDNNQTKNTAVAVESKTTLTHVMSSNSKAEALRFQGLKQIQSSYSKYESIVVNLNDALDRIDKYGYNRIFTARLLASLKCSSIDNLMDMRENALFIMDGLTLVHQIVSSQPLDCTEYMCKTIKVLNTLPETWMNEIGDVLDKESRFYVLKGIKEGTDIMKQQLNLQFDA